ncbi:FMN-binding negative transcriptional regulator [Bdellovibrio sp. NC01]|uniref:FMN-binding negative transcriptional regulator n=1 Tax=Bdellovibrio sp. NC01 TaxID=2220073 RepID=UPI001159FE2F|nr:FMN-binding negative transcriptional regulator [Bdellovibrio sp. NC01]QDK37171.1 FMN-binding negative transcriptional regulator [Bdellovibrio sp. NC01]
MYRPSAFNVDDTGLLSEFIAHYPLGMMITVENNEPQISHLPFVMTDNGDLIGHIANMNPQTQGLHDKSVLVSFKGPDRYISPEWYESKMEVPTWNYAAIEVRGNIELVKDFSGIEDILSASVTAFEKRNHTQWNYDLPLKFREQLVKHITGIKIHIETIEGKFKLSQNRKKQDQEKVRAELKKQILSSDLEMLLWMDKTKT